MTYKYDLNEWHEDIKGLLKRFLASDQPIVFLITDSQVCIHFFKNFVDFFYSYLKD
jgi:hypothetical protein